MCIVILLQVSLLDCSWVKSQDLCRKRKLFVQKLLKVPRNLPPRLVGLKKRVLTFDADTLREPLTSV